MVAFFNTLGVLSILGGALLLRYPSDEYGGGLIDDVDVWNLNAVPSILWVSAAVWFIGAAVLEKLGTIAKQQREPPPLNS